MPARSIVIITFMRCVVISLEKFTMIFYDHTLILRPFQLSNNNEQFHCRACGFDDSELSLFQSYYCCDSCNFNLHVECASIPITLNHKKKYPLHLFLSFPITSEAAALFCSICAKEVPTSGCWVFYNHDHDYLCHFECAAVTEYATNNDSMSELQTRLQTLVLTNSPPTPPDLSCGDVTHYHALREFVSSWPLRFNLCEFTVFSGYICSDCNYFIDKNCFSIPSKIQHMSHPQHPLKFTRYTDFMHEDLKCTGCDADFKHLGNGRAYYCTQCKFIINRYCASAPKSLTLEDNVSYELFFSFPFKHGNAEIDCNICSDVVVIKDGLFYYNRECHEALHVICALDEEAGFDNDKMDMLSIQRLQELRII
uniref:DC1 domain containing protein n=2 Tax=Solanum tuberosum TaxID=4113 RepID=M1D8W3_SOLTU